MLFSNLIEKIREKQISNDAFSVILLLLLYTLQGIPFGLTSSISYLLKANANSSSYEIQATFSISMWPFSIKLLWAPFVDSFYSSFIGRRKSWLIPTQYAISCTLFILAHNIDYWLGREPNNPWGDFGVAKSVDIIYLTIAFFSLTFLAATQDISVDGWALTILSVKNVGWASTCNIVGITLGYIISFMGFLCLESPQTSNNYLRKELIEGQGLISLSGFLYFCGILFLIITTLIGLFKNEKDSKFTNYLKHCFQSIFKPKLVIVFNQSRPDCNNLRLNNFTSPNIHEIDSNLSPTFSLLSDQPNFTNNDGDRSKDDYENTTTMGKQELLIDKINDENESKKSNNMSLISTTKYDLRSRKSLFLTYRLMFGVLGLNPIWQYIIILFVLKLGVEASETVFHLRLIDNGLSKERIAILSLILIPARALFPLFVVRWTNATRKLSTVIWLVLPRILISSATIPIVYYTPYLRVPILTNSTDQTNLKFSSTSTIQYDFPWYYYIILISYYCVYSLINTTITADLLSFHAKISDPEIGGSYMTLLNTVANLSSSLTSTLFLALVEPLTIRNCDNVTPFEAGLRSANSYSNDSYKNNNTSNSELIEKGYLWLKTNGTCKVLDSVKACENIGGKCGTYLDGFYVEIVFSLLFGCVTFPIIVYPLVKRFQNLSVEAYRYHITNQHCCLLHKFKNYDHNHQTDMQDNKLMLVEP